MHGKSYDGANKNAALPPRFSTSYIVRSSLRLRLQPGIRVGTRTRLAGRRYCRGARRGWLQHRLAVGLLALQQVDDLVAGQGLEFEQTLRQGFEIGPLFGQYLGRLVVAFLDQTLDLAVDLLDGRFRGILGA